MSAPGARGADGATGPASAAGAQPPLRILLISQFYPGPEHPDLGVFVAQLAEELERRGHRLSLAAVDRRGGPPTKHLRLAATAAAAALRRRPDVVYAHFLVPAGAIGAAVSRAMGVPLVVTAHGQDVRNVGAIPGIRPLTAATVRQATTVVANSRFLLDQLVREVPAAETRGQVIDCGVDLDRFAPRDRLEARRRVGLEDVAEPVFLFVGSLVDRKNVVRLRDAFEGLATGSLVLVGDGPLRGHLEGRPRVRVVGRVAHDAVPDWIAAADVVCLPSLVEPFGQALLEAMAGERSVVATRVGGPPEFVGPGAGALVDPLSVESIRDGLRRAAELPCPNRAARAAAAEHDLRRQATRIEAVLREAALRSAGPRARRG